MGGAGVSMAYSPCRWLRYRLPAAPRVLASEPSVSEALAADELARASAYPADMLGAEAKALAAVRCPQGASAGRRSYEGKSGPQAGPGGQVVTRERAKVWCSGPGGRCRRRPASWAIARRCSPVLVALIRRLSERAVGHLEGIRARRSPTAISNCLLLAYRRSSRTVIAMPTHRSGHGRKSRSDAATIDELLALPSATRLQLLRDLLAGRSVQRIVVQVPVLVRSLSLPPSDRGI